MNVKNIVGMIGEARCSNDRHVIFETISAIDFKYLLGLQIPFDPQSVIGCVDVALRPALRNTNQMIEKDTFPSETNPA